VHDSFFDLGGHSLLATRLMSRVRATFGSELPLARLFDAPTIAELAEGVDAARTAGTVVRTEPIRPLPPEARSGELPLSFAQERLWFLDRIETGSAVYNVPLSVRLRGALSRSDIRRLAAAFGSIVARHEALRTVFPERDGDPVQQILPAGGPPGDPSAWSLPVVDLTALPRPVADGEARALAALDSLRPFSLETGPLLRTTLLELGTEDDHLLLLNMHHIVSDGWSLGVLLSELAAFYGGDPSLLPELPVQYADFAAWQRDWLRGGELERQTAYWRRQLAGAPAVLELPTDRPRPLLQTWRGAHLPVRLPEPLTARLAALGRRQGVTPFMLLLAAWSVLLHRHSAGGRQKDVSVGSPIAGRNRSETERLIGFFVNTLVLRSDLADDPSFPELLARTRRTALAAYDHQDLPFEKLVDELKPERTMSHQPLFQVMFVLQNAPLGALELPGLTLEPLDVGAVIAKFDLTLSLMERGGEIGGFLEFNTDLYDAATALRLRGHFEVLLEGIAENPERPVSELPWLSAGERQQLLVEWADARAEPLGLCLHELFEEVAERHAGLLAVVDDNGTAWTYAELNRRANQLAWRLRSLGVAPETRVALCVDRSAEMLVGMLGVLKAGGAYVPLDPAYPRERLSFMLADTGAPVLLTQERLRGLLPAGKTAIICLDSEEETARRDNPPPAATGSSPAYVIYTSGSTGTPKGVVVPHDAVVAYSQASSALYGTRPGDRDLQFSSISFDASVEEIYGCLTRGATLYVRGDAQEGVSELLDRCREQEITLLQFPTAFWHQLATAMEAESLLLPPSVRTLFVGGEKMLAPRLVSWSRLLPPGVVLFNAYGPTETTVACAVCPFPGPVPIDGNLREVPLGRPLSYVRAYVLDRGLRPVPIGVTGELFVGGLGLARGYLDRPDLTAERFVPNPVSGVWGWPGERLYRTGDLVRLLPGGLLEFVGRADGQVKIRGYRIEPGEIEETLAGHPRVGQAVVLTREDVPGEARLVAYVSSLSNKAGEQAPEPAELREYLAERLPSYMVPATLLVLPALPVSAPGKVDRHALARLAPSSGLSSGTNARRERPAWAAPQNELEERIAVVWRELFGLADPDALGVDDNFFDSGGTSLLLVKLHSRLQKALERSFPLVEIFKHPTIRTLAASLGAEQPAKPTLEKARARTDARRESMRQLQQLRDQRRGIKR
jgi:amino acid adenylation domain-containing protein